MDDQQAGTVVTEIEGPIATIRLSRPRKLNALDHGARVGLATAFAAIAHHDEVRVVILEGEGTSFCAGQDQNESAVLDATLADRRIETYASLFDAIRRTPQPVIAKIRGYAVGAGLQIALCCDLRIAGEGARVGLTELNVGSPCITGSTLLWPIAGEAAVRHIVLTGEFVPARRAAELGIVGEVVDDDELDERVRALAAKLAERSVTAVRLTKQWWHEVTEPLFQQGMARAHRSHAQNFDAGSLSSGAQAFVGRERGDHAAG